MIRDVRDLSLDERQALELVLGKSLRDDEIVSIDVASAPVSSVTVDAATVPDWWNVYQGLSDADIDELDRSIQRLDMTRGEN
jgi:hypothetical protein